jgi:hypothetical protein
VSGVTASSYISLMDDDTLSPNMQAVLSHIALAPLRMVCEFSSFSICQNELYSDDGFSMNLWTLIQFGHYFKASTIPIQLLTLIVVAPLLCTVSSLEMAVNHGTQKIITLTVGLVVITISKMKTGKKPQTSK